MVSAAMTSSELHLHPQISQIPQIFPEAFSIVKSAQSADQ